jgi:hypothetical protein
MTGVFPDHLKYAVIKSLYMKGERSSIFSYRPVSLLTVLSKVLEKTVYCRLNHHLQVNTVKDLSTEYAAYSLIDGILHAWNSKIHVAGFFCDLAKALDYINHKISVLKLQYSRLNDTYINCFKSYLINRRQRENINNT